MPHRSRKDIEAENLVLLDKLEAVRDDLDDFLGDADEETDDEIEDESTDEDTNEGSETGEPD